MCLRPIVVFGILASSIPAWGYDAARCMETRQAIAKLEADLSHGPTAQDKLAFDRALTVYRKVEPVFCGAGFGGGLPGVGTGGGSTPAGLGALINSLNLLNSALSASGGADTKPAIPATPTLPTPTLPTPTVPTGSVNGPLIMQRLPSLGQANSAPAVPAPSITVSEPVVALPQPTVAVNLPTTASPHAAAMQDLEQTQSSPFPTDLQIAQTCIGTANPSMCELARESQRDRDPAYLRWKHKQDALRERNIDRAIANVDAAIAASQRNGPGLPGAGTGRAPSGGSMPGLSPAVDKPIPVDAGAAAPADPVVRSADIDAIACAHLKGEYRKVVGQNQWYCEYDPQMLPVNTAAQSPPDIGASEHCRNGIDQLRLQRDQQADIDPVYLRTIAMACAQAGIPFSEEQFRYDEALRALRNRADPSGLQVQLAEATQLRQELEDLFGQAARQSDAAYATLKRQNAIIDKLGEALAGAVSKPLQQALKVSRAMVKAFEAAGLSNANEIEEVLSGHITAIMRTPDGLRPQELFAQTQEQLSYAQAQVLGIAEMRLANIRERLAQIQRERDELTRSASQSR